MKKKFLRIGCVILITVFLSSCAKSDEQSVKEDKKKVESNTSEQQAESSTIAVYDRNAAMWDHPENLRTKAEEEQVFFFGDRGIYNVSGEEWTKIYDGERIQGMDLYQGNIYFIQGNAEQNGNTLYRMNYRGENVEVILENANFLSWISFTNQVLYGYSADSLEIIGYRMTADGTIGEAVDVSADDYLYRLENAQLDAENYPAQEHIVDPGYSRRYYGGTFLQNANDEASLNIIWEDGEGAQKQLTTCSLESSGNICVAENTIYYKKELGNNDIEAFSLPLRTKEIVYSGDAPVRILNYDYENLYIMEESSTPDDSVREIMIKKMNRAIYTVEDLFAINVTSAYVPNVDKCFDVMNSWCYYRDAESGSLVRRDIKDISKIQPEP